MYPLFYPPIFFLIPPRISFSLIFHVVSFKWISWIFTLMYLYCSRCIIREETEVQYALNDILSSFLESRSESKLPRRGCCWRPQDGVFPIVARSVSMVLTTRNTNSGEKNRSFFLQKFALLWSFFCGIIVCLCCVLVVCVCVLLLRSRGFSSRRDRDSSLRLFVLLDVGSSSKSVEVLF